MVVQRLASAVAAFGAPAEKIDLAIYSAYLGKAAA
jgi:hypothetical protein